MFLKRPHGERKLKRKVGEKGDREERVSFNLFLMDVDWANLPKDLLGMIAKRLSFTTDYARFSSVCRSWHAVALENRHHLPVQLPFLMIRFSENSKNHRFYSVRDRRILPFLLPMRHKRLCRGSTFGWLTTVGKDLSIHLFNPFSQKEIQLPPLTAGFNRFKDQFRSDTFVQKAVISANPNSAIDYIVMVIYGALGKLAFFKAGDKGWNTIESQHQAFDDIVFYKGQFHAINYWGRVVICDVASQPTAVELPLAVVSESKSVKRYLVESSGELLQVVRGFVSERNDDGFYTFRTCGFEVFYLDSSKWVKVKRLDDVILFLGDNTSLSVSASDFPECRGNHIYFTDDHYDHYIPAPVGSYDMGVFNLEDGSTRSYSTVDDLAGQIAPPIWVSPTLDFTMGCR